MSEDRNKHDRAGTEVPVGRRLGSDPESRRARMRAGMSQHTPDRVRAKVDGTDAKTQGKTTKGKGSK